MTRKAKQPALPPVLPLVAVPYVSPGQLDRLRAAFASSPEWLAVVDVFAAATVADQYAALDELRAVLLALIDERPVDDPRGAVAAPPTDPADGGVAAAVDWVNARRSLSAGPVECEAFETWTRALAGEVVAGPAVLPGGLRMRWDGGDGDGCRWCGCAVESGQRVCAPCAAADAGTGGLT